MHKVFALWVHVWGLFCVLWNLNQLLNSFYNFCPSHGERKSGLHCVNDNGVWDKGVPFRTERRVMGMSPSQCQWTGQCRWIPQKAGNPPASWVSRLVSPGLAKKNTSTLVAAVPGCPCPPHPGAGSAQGLMGLAALARVCRVTELLELQESQSLMLLHWGLAWIAGNKCSCVSVQGFVPTNELCSQLHDEMRSRFIASVCVLQVFWLGKTGSWVYYSCVILWDSTH